MQLINKLNTSFFVGIFIFFFAVLYNQYIGNKGIFPIDSFLHFDTGYRIYLGEYPFKDYWVVSGPLIDLLQSALFFLFGVSWKSYVLNGSLLNGFFSVLSYFIFKKGGLAQSFSIFYSISVAILAYPVSASPFVDLHSTYFAIIAVYFFIISLITKKNFYFFFIPIFLSLAFFSKQVPAGYLFISIFICLFFYLLINGLRKNLDILIILLLSSLICFSTFLAILKINKIPIPIFLEQYIFYPSEIGNKRFSFSIYNFKNLILNFKLIHVIFFTYFVLIFYQLRSKKTFIKSNNFIIFLLIFFSFISLINHQILTRNQIFIFFLIPIFCALAHIELNKNFQNKKKFYNILLIIFCLTCVLKYNYRFNIERKFHELENVNFSNSIDAGIIDKKLSGLNWITPNKKTKKDVIDEINFIKKIIKNLTEDKENKMVITNYSFFSVLLGKSQNGITRAYPGDNSAFPNINSFYLQSYKYYFKDKLIKNNIKKIYILYDVSKNNLTDYISNECLKQELSNELFIKFYFDSNCNYK